MSIALYRLSVRSIIAAFVGIVAIRRCWTVAGFAAAPAQGATTAVAGIAVHRVPLRHSDPASPYALAVTNGCDLPDTTIAPENDGALVRRSVNFLATQVWPSARTAALEIERYVQNNPATATELTVCEFGCGPGLPSLTAARLGASRVYATDVDGLALELVRHAAIEQGVSDRLETRYIDLLQSGDDGDAGVDAIPLCDVYILSDVFENGAVAEGAARVTVALLHRQNIPSVWVFAQSDRAQREIYLRELQRLLCDPSLSWRHYESGSTVGGGAIAETLQRNGRLWLCDIDETNVFYG